MTDEPGVADALASMDQQLGYLELGADGEDELTAIGYEDAAVAMRLGRTMLLKTRAALRQCLPLLREDLDGLVSSNTAWTRAAARDTGEALRCITATFTTDRCAENMRDEVAPLIHAIRTAEALVGRERGEHDSAWLDAVIDGEAGI